MAEATAIPPIIWLWPRDGIFMEKWEDVHGAGAQRSDPKSGSLTDYTYVPYGYYNSDRTPGRCRPAGTTSSASCGTHKSRWIPTATGSLMRTRQGIYGTNPNDPDSDGDGMNDGAEIVAGTSPLSDTSYLFIGISGMVSNTVSLYWPSVAGCTYYLEGTTNLSSGTWETSGVYSAAPPTNTMNLTVTNSPYFFRLRVEKN